MRLTSTAPAAAPTATQQAVPAAPVLPPKPPAPKPAKDTFKQAPAQALVAPRRAPARTT